MLKNLLLFQKVSSFEILTQEAEQDLTESCKQAIESLMHVSARENLVEMIKSHKLEDIKQRRDNSRACDAFFIASKIEGVTQSISR